MRENMPGMGYAQGRVDLVDRGPRIMTDFDRSYVTGHMSKALSREADEIKYLGGPPGQYRFLPLPTDARDVGARGAEADVADRRPTMKSTNVQYGPDGKPENKGYRPLGYNRPMAEEGYVNALYEFFHDRISLWPGTPMGKEYLRMVMHDTRSTRDIADDIGVSQPAIVQGRQRAIASFAEFMGGKAALAEKLRQYLFDRELQDGRDRLKYLPRWIHG